MTRLKEDLASFLSETDRLLKLLSSAGSLDPTHQKVVAEVVLLRLLILIENTTKVIFCRIICGATYLDGSMPLLRVATSKNAPAAVHAMQSIGRDKAWRLSWNDAAQVRDNIKFVIDARDPCFATMITYASTITEIRFIRNHIAHRNDGTRKNYRKVIVRYYGARVRGVTCGTLLISPRVSTPTLLEVLIRKSRAFMRELTRAP